MQIPFIGGSYYDRSSDFNAQRCINLYPVLGTEDSKTPIALYPTFGLKQWCNGCKVGEVRTMFVAGSYLYALVGNSFYQIDSSANATNKGTVGDSTGNAWMEWNSPNDELMVVCNNTGYIYDIGSDTFTEIADADFRGATSLAFQDGFFVVTDPDTQRVYASDSYAGTSWNALSYKLKGGSTDNAICVVSDHRELWVFGPKTTEVWYNSGASPFPFTRKVDEIIEYGIGAVASAVGLDNTIFWLDNKKRVVRAEGYSPVPVSTRSVEHQVGTYSTVSDAKAFASYAIKGHPTYIITFPTANATWAYDVATKFWYELQSFPPPYNNRWRGNCYAEFSGKSLVGDHANGKIYELHINTYTDNNNPIGRERTTQVIHDDRKLLFTHALEVDFESGVGLTTGQGSDPQAMLQWSDDGGHTWGNEHWSSIGKIGEYGARAVWRRLGRSRNRIYRLRITDPVKTVILGARADIEKGTS